MRRHRPREARPVREKLAALDSANRLGIRDLLSLVEEMERDAEEAMA